MSIINIFQRLTVREIVRNNRSVTTPSVLYIHSTPALCAEPLKKKKKIDPQVIKQREDRKRKKLEKQIRRLEKNARQLKPIDELEVPIDLIDEKSKRMRVVAVTPEVLEQRVLLNKQWAKYKHGQKVADFQIIDRVMQFQAKALDELRKESEELYQEAIQPDIQLLPVNVKGPVSTPPIEHYSSPDGEYIHLTKNWEVIVYNRKSYKMIKDRLKTKGLNGLSKLDLYNYFAPWYAEHLGQIRTASGNSTVEKWARRKLQYEYYVFKYITLLKLHGNATLLRTLDSLLGNEAILQLDLKSLNIIFTNEDKQKWFTEILDNYLKLWEVNMGQSKR